MYIHICILYVSSVWYLYVRMIFFCIIILIWESVFHSFQNTSNDFLAFKKPCTQRIKCNWKLICPVSASRFCKISLMKLLFQGNWFRASCILLKKTIHFEMFCKNLVEKDWIDYLMLILWIPSILFLSEVQKI